MADDSYLTGGTVNHSNSARLASLWRMVRQAFVWVALSIGGLPFLVLDYARPLQYDVVVIDAVERAWPFVLAVAFATIATGISYWILRTNDGLSPLRALISAALPAWLLTSAVLIAGGSTTVIATGLASLLLLCLICLLLLKHNQVGTMPKLISTPWAGATAGTGLFLCLTVATTVSPIELPRQIGSLAIFAAFAGLLAIYGSFGTQRPRIAALGAGYIVFAAFTFAPNDHHTPITTSIKNTKSLDGAFLEWVKNRKDLNAYRDQMLPYPVILVSSEGGGVYAAAHAYGTLSVISANCPTFTQHIFALVGVSGGALGDAMFAAEIPTEQKAQAPCRLSDGNVRSLPVTADHLSPVLARLLFVELVDRALPGKWLSRDRAQILADSFLYVARDAAFLQRAERESFDTSSARPAVISVATNVADGRRFVVSPFAPDSFAGTAQWWPGSNSFADQPTQKEDVNVIDGAGLAARFPWITPTGLLSGANGNEFLLADGGYFENSGADTVLDLINALRYTSNRNLYPATSETEERLNGRDCKEDIVNVVRDFHTQVAWRKCEIRVFPIHLAIASNDKPEPKDDDEFWQQQTTPFSGRQSFALDPLSTLLATRGSRGEIALSRADLELCGTKLPGADCYANPDSSFGFFRNDIRPEEWQLPLGWYMPSALFDVLQSGSINREIFNYHVKKEVASTDLEYLIFHLDPTLYREGADPSINDLLGGP
ncbi:hypothetical protein IB276_34355 [Ensifer sp. ENS04]|uniref:hypothetical protein n=1 Tax=Ensifer sp. ENS04 TaxID=2769281 RepID=UPI00178760E2|nr:hypothetical protein [Ensifer sp. ENS04]MBD9544523.1 hypothetical protein [Ensifer sp. ENS04]